MLPEPLLRPPAAVPAAPVPVLLVLPEQPVAVLPEPVLQSGELQPEAPTVRAERAVRAAVAEPVERQPPEAAQEPQAAA